MHENAKRQGGKCFMWNDDKSKNLLPEREFKGTDIQFKSRRREPSVSRSLENKLLTVEIFGDHPVTSWPSSGCRLTASEKLHPIAHCLPHKIWKHDFTLQRVRSKRKMAKS
jgi:hypothetical protein